MGAEFGMIKDENEDPSLPKNSDGGGEADGKKHAHGGLLPAA